MTLFPVSGAHSTARIPGSSNLMQITPGWCDNGASKLNIRMMTI